MIFRRNNNKNKKARYGVIRRSGDNIGLFSFFITVLGGMNFCYKNELIPIVDMKTGNNQYKRHEKDNVWELFFEQPEGIGLDDVEDWKEVQIIDCEKVLVRPYLNMDFLTNPYAILFWRKFVKKHIRLSEKSKDNINRFLERYIKPYKHNVLLGVLARGTDYSDLKPLSHPVQPSFDELKEKVDEFLKKYDCTKIFLVTEDIRICNNFLDKYGDMIILPEASRYGTTEGRYLAEIKKNEDNKVDSAFTYLASIIGLTQCDYFVAGRTSGTLAAVIMSDDFKDKFFFNLGKYGIDDVETLSLLENI